MVKYETPDMEIVYFFTDDIITVSDDDTDIEL